jgi:ABC-type sulfate/molybdate transport systems ATPase subunit
MELWAEDQKTALMVTHDVDEALLLSDRVVMMTNGPAAHVGDILSVTLPRPRQRGEITRHTDYYRLREHLIGFLESQERHGKTDVVATTGATASEHPNGTTSFPDPAPVNDAARRAEPLLAAG